ncbi:MAG TPA: hypothetical protein PK916_09230 [Bacteroidota bacterium]|nr:hypothetical protein [Bacteroidota bacterium]
MIQALRMLARERTEELRIAGVVLGIIVLLVAMGEHFVRTPATLLAMIAVIGAGVLVLVNMRLALFLFVAFLVSYEEFNLSSQEAFVEENIANTVLAVKVFGFAVMDVVSLLLLLPVLVREWAHALRAGAWRVFPADRYLMPLLLVWVFGALHGWWNALSFSAYTWDIRMLGHVLVFYFIFSRVFRTQRDYWLALLLAGAVLLARQGVFLWRYASGGGLDIGGYSRVLLGSDLPLTAVLLCMSVVTALLYRRRAPRVAIAALPLAAYFAVMLVAGLGKLTYLQAAYALVMIGIMHRREISARQLGVVFVVAVGAVFVVYTLFMGEAMREAISYALGSAFNWVDALKLYGDLSFGTRYLEIVNVWAVLQREGALLWGLGWGAPWAEIAVHLPFDGGAFDVAEQYSGIHVQTHIDALTFLLKVGILGTLAVYASMLRFWWEGVRRYAGLVEPWQKWTLMALLLLIVIIVPNYLYFIRLKYLLGFAMAGAAVFLPEYHDAETHDTRIADSHHAE